MRVISGQKAWDCGLLGGVIQIEKAAASSMASTTEFSCVCAVLAVSNALLSSFMRDVSCSL